jgi:hypothetical protein
MNKLVGGSELFLGLLLACVSGMALADRGHGRYRGHADVGVGIVVTPSWHYPRPYYYPYYYPSYNYPPYYYPPAVVTVPATPPVYIEREADSTAAPEASAYWYYCADPQGYYPYVRACPGGWQAVAPEAAREER